MRHSPCLQSQSSNELWHQTTIGYMKKEELQLIYVSFLPYAVFWQNNKYTEKDMLLLEHSRPRKLADIKIGKQLRQVWLWLVWNDRLRFILHCITPSLQPNWTSTDSINCCKQLFFNFCQFIIGNCSNWVNHLHEIVYITSSVAWHHSYHCIIARNSPS